MTDSLDYEIVGKTVNHSTGREFVRIKIEYGSLDYAAKITSVEGKEDGYLVLNPEGRKRLSTRDWYAMEPEEQPGWEINGIDPSSFLEQGVEEKEDVDEILESHGYLLERELKKSFKRSRSETPGKHVYNQDSNRIREHHQRIESELPEMDDSFEEFYRETAGL